MKHADKSAQFPACNCPSQKMLRPSLWHNSNCALLYTSRDGHHLLHPFQSHCLCSILQGRGLSELTVQNGLQWQTSLGGRRVTDDKHQNTVALQYIRYMPMPALC